jgi:hypothetical protein
VSRRVQVIEALERPRWTRDEDPKPAPKAVTKAVDELLVKALDDPEPDHYSYGNNVNVLDHPRVCDWSAGLLAKRWGRSERFDDSVPVKTRDALIAVLKEVWRKERAKKP